MNSKSFLTIKFKELLSEPLRNGIYKKKEFHGSGSKIVNMGELFAYPRLKSNTQMKRVELNANEKVKSTLQSGDLIFARRSLTAEGAGKCSIILSVDEETTFESSIIRARLNSNIANPEFYYYFFNSFYGKVALGTILRQVAVAGITGSDLALLDVPNPPKPLQDKIAEISRDFDEKIELNTQLNQTLESIAQAIFKSWFVDFDPVKAKIAALESGGTQEAAELAAMCTISGKNEAQLAQLKTQDADAYRQLAQTAALFPAAMQESEQGEIPEGWEVKPVGNCCDTFDYVANGSFEALKNNVQLFDEPNDVLYVRTTDHNKSFTNDLKYTDLKSYEFLKKSKLYGRETIISNVGDVGTVFRAPTWLGLPMTLGSNAIALNSPGSDAYIFWLFRSHIGQHLISSVVTGSAQMKFNKTNFRSLAILWPNQQLIFQFEKIENVIWQKISACYSEMNKLTNLRDSLLPRLLSGEIDLGNFDNSQKELAE